MRWLVLLVVLSGCPVRYVAQDAHTGPDGESDGAEVMQLKENEAHSSGSVDFPAGDRVDWKWLALPTSAPGDGAGLALRFEWRGDGKLAFVVYDEAGRVLLDGADETEVYDDTRRQWASLYVTGPVYVEIYAVEGGDGGRYFLSVTYTPAIDWSALQVPDPPPLGAVPLPICGPSEVPERNPCRFWPECSTDADLDPDNPNCSWFFHNNPDPYP